MDLSLDLVLPISLLSILIYAVAKRIHDARKSQQAPAIASTADQVKSAASAHPELDIEPLDPSLQFEHIQPLQLRPYKPIYYMTMGLKTCTHSDLFPLDKTYPAKIALREKLIAEHPEYTIKVIPQAKESVTEMYEWIMGTYLPMKMPQNFVKLEEEQMLWNKVTDRKHPLSAPQDLEEALRILTVNIETDLLLMEQVTDKDSPNFGKYILTAIAVCFPNGLNFINLIGEPLAAIHAPVPKYKEKLEMSMDRFFNKLESGKVVQRHNWTITAHQNLFSPKGLKLRQDNDDREAPREDKQTQIAQELAPDCALRVERQTLHRFPKSKAILFGVHTYLYPLKDIKAEGQGEALATAVEGLFPEMGFFKSRPIWGEAVKSYLRS